MHLFSLSFPSLQKCRTPAWYLLRHRVDSLTATLGVTHCAQHMSLGYDSLTYPSDIAAFPDSVNALEGVCGDVRTPDKLIDQVNNTSDGRHMWLAPILPGLVGTWPWGWRGTCPCAQ